MDRESKISKPMKAFATLNKGVSSRDFYKSSRGLRGQSLISRHVMVLVCNTMIDEEI